MQKIRTYNRRHENGLGSGIDME